MKPSVLKTVLLAVLTLLLLVVSMRYWLPLGIGVLLSWQDPIRSADVGTARITPTDVDVSELKLQFEPGTGLQDARIGGLHIRWREPGSSWFPRRPAVEIERALLTMAKSRTGDREVDVNDLAQLLAQPGRIGARLPVRSLHVQRLEIEGARIEDIRPVGELSLQREDGRLWTLLRMDAGAGRRLDLVLVATPEQLAVQLAGGGAPGLKLEQSLVGRQLEGKLIVDPPLLAKMLQPWCGAVAAIDSVCSGKKYASLSAGRITGGWRFGGRGSAGVDWNAQIDFPVVARGDGIMFHGTPRLDMQYQPATGMQATLTGEFRVSQSRWKTPLAAAFNTRLHLQGEWRGAGQGMRVRGGIRLLGSGEHAVVGEVSSDGLEIHGAHVSGPIRLDVRAPEIEAGEFLAREIQATLAVNFSVQKGDLRIDGEGRLAAQAVRHDKREIEDLVLDFSPRYRSSTLLVPYKLSSARPKLSMNGTVEVNAEGPKGSFHWKNDSLPQLQSELSAIELWPQVLVVRQGSVGISGTAERNNASGRPRVQARLDMKEVGGVYANSLFTGFNLEAGLDLDGDHMQLATHTLSLGKVTRGVPVEQIQGKLSYRAESLFEPGRGTLRVDGVSGALLGGKFQVPPFRFTPDTGPVGVRVKLIGVSLGSILALQGGADLRGDGTLDAELPLQFSQHGIRIAKGQIQARSPGGMIQYRPQKTPAFLAGQASTQMILDALHDYAFQVLSSTVSMQTDGTLTLGVRLQGIARGLDKGRAVNFSLHLEDNLYDQLVSLQLAGKLDDVIEKRLRKRYRQGKD